jgi:KaiC/GvpD/RAD55 family RecA-like ATPase
MSAQEKAEEMRKLIADILAGASAVSDTKPFVAKTPAMNPDIVIRPDQVVSKNGIVPFKTGTFIDQLFTNGIPKVSQVGITGLPDSGKSLFAQELVLRLADIGYSVILILNEDAWKTENERNDVQSRMREKADKLKLNWENIRTHLYVFDTVSKPQLLDWATLIETYRAVVESQNATILVVDSLTLIEDSRGAIKYRLLELARYNQMHGVTSFMISQRSTEDADNFGMAGGIGLSHIFDIVLAMDYKKVSSFDAQLKVDIPDAKQGTIIRFARILKCRLCKFDGRYRKIEITDEGFVK